MTLRQQIRPRILRVIRAADGTPVPEGSVIGAVTPFVLQSTDTDVKEQLKALESEGLVVSELDLISEHRSYTLTTKGALAAKQL